MDKQSSENIRNKTNKQTERKDNRAQKKRRRSKIGVIVNKQKSASATIDAKTERRKNTEK